MNEFDKAMEFLIKWEGYKTVDTGGTTIFGISEKAHPTAINQMLTMSKKKQLAYAKEIYKREYWDKLPFTNLENNFKWALVLFDTAVNVGVDRVNEWLMEAKIYSWQDFLDRRIEYYLDLAARPKYRKYLLGWMNRVADLKRTVKEND